MKAFTGFCFHRDSCLARKSVWIGCGLMLLSGFVSAELEVIEDRGGVDASRYYEVIGSRSPSGASGHPLGQVSEANMLPVRPQRISPGRVSRREINAPDLRPFFMVGDDDLSKQWLIERGEALSTMGAVGMVVEVETVERLAQLRALAPGLKMLPTSGDDVAGRVGLEHYPVLITAKSVEQ
jgi:integrating conjugative element protein (TIGR03765 family)